MSENICSELVQLMEATRDAVKLLHQEYDQHCSIVIKWDGVKLVREELQLPVE